MPISPTRISQPNAATNIDQDWSAAMKDSKRKIPLELSENLKKTDPEAYNLLSQLTPDQQKALKAADSDRSGSLSLSEVKGYLLKNGALKTGGKFDTTAEALNVLFSKATGKNVDIRKPNASVLYLTANNNASNRANQTAEKNGLKSLVAKDADKPDFTGLDITSEFNKGPAEAQTAFREGMKAYLDDLVKNGGTMTGLVVSGHSNGTSLLHERPHHGGYDANLDIRAELKRFKEMEEPAGSGKFPYKEIFDKTEKVGLLACFQGGNLEEWRQIFPNAVLAGTEAFSPDAGSAASPAIYGAAQAARQYYEDGGDFSKAEAVGRKVPGANTDGLQTTRQLKISVPKSAADALKAAQGDYDTAKVAYDAVKSEIDKVMRDGKSAATPTRMRELYEIAKKFENACNSLKAAGGTTPGVDPARQKAISDQLFANRF
ncbi:MAG: hypothetical protein QM817_11990 [Archangium sp.]